MTWRPRRGFRVGAMRERIDIQTATTTYTNGEPNRTWSVSHDEEPAAFDPATGGESVRGKQVDAEVAAIFTVHYHDDVSTEDRIVHAGRNYGIVRIVPVEGGKRYLDIHCKLGGVGTYG